MTALKNKSLKPTQSEASSKYEERLNAAVRYPEHRHQQASQEHVKKLDQLQTSFIDLLSKDPLFVKLVTGSLSAQALWHAFEDAHLFLEQNKAQMFPNQSEGSEIDETDKAENWKFVERFEYLLSTSLAAYQDTYMVVHRPKNKPAPHPYAHDYAIERTDRQKINLTGAYAELVFLREYFSMLIFVRVAPGRRWPGLLTPPSGMSDTFPDVFGAYEELRRAVLALHASHIKILLDPDDEEMAGRTSRCDEECATNQRILISQRLTKERMTRPLAEARKLRAKLELQMDIMEAYTEATLKK
jgi:hypothetical protein